MGKTHFGLQNLSFFFSSLSLSLTASFWTTKLLAPGKHPRRSQWSAAVTWKTTPSTHSIVVLIQIKISIGSTLSPFFRFQIYIVFSPIFIVSMINAIFDLLCVTLWYFLKLSVTLNLFFNCIWFLGQSFFF